MTHYHSYRQPEPMRHSSGNGPKSRSASFLRRFWIGFAKWCLVALVITSILQFGVYQPALTRIQQSERNRAAAQLVQGALTTASISAVSYRVPIYWVQSRIGGTDRPYMGGSVWHIDFGGDKGMQTLERGELDPASGVNLYCPGGEVGFDADGRPRNGAVQLRIDSDEPGQSFLIDVAADGTATIAEAKS